MPSGLTSSGSPAQVHAAVASSEHADTDVKQTDITAMGSTSGDLTAPTARRERVGRPNRLPSRLRKAQRAGRVADWLSMFWPSRNPATLPVPMRRLGVFMQWGIGDAVLLEPLLRALRAAYPAASLELIGRPWLRELFGSTGLADEVHELAPPWTRYAAKYRVWQPAWWRFWHALLRLRRCSFDVLVSPRCDPREAIQLRVLRSRLRVGYGARAGRHWLDIDLGASHLLLDTHASAAAVRLAEVMTAKHVDARPRLPVPPEIVDAAAAALDAAGYSGGPILAICLDAGAPIREWSPRGFEQVLQDVSTQLGFVVVIADPGRPPKQLRLPDGVASMVWRTNLRQLRGLLSVSDLLLCNDSGVMHMASACGCRVVAVFGPTSKDWFGPTGESDEVVLHEPMPCRPCCDLCIYPRPLCMERIAPGQVSQAVARALAQVRQIGRAHV